MAKAFKELTEEERQRQQRRQEIARLWAEGESCRAIWLTLTPIFCISAVIAFISAWSI